MSPIKASLKKEVRLIKGMRIATINGYQSLSAFVLRNGREFSAALSPRYRGIGERKQCYTNALALASRNPDLIYVEGYLWHHFPIPHAWCVTQSGKVIEPTPLPGLADEYFGVPISTKFALRVVAVRGHYGILDCPEQDWPLLRADPKEWKVSFTSRRLSAKAA